MQPAEPPPPPAPFFPPPPTPPNSQPGQYLATTGARPARPKKGARFVKTYVAGLIVAATGVFADIMFLANDPPPGTNDSNVGNVHGLIALAVIGGIGAVLVFAGMVVLVRQMLQRQQRLRSGFAHLAIVFSVLTALALFAGSNPLPAIASGSPDLPVLTYLADTLGSDGVAGLSIALFSVAVGLIAAAVIVSTVALLRRSSRRPAWLLMLVLAFALGYTGFVVLAVLVAVGGLVLAIVTWLDIRGWGSAISAAAARLRLPGVRARTIGWRAGTMIALAVIVAPAGLYALGATVANLPYHVAYGGFAAVSNPLTGANVSIYQITSSGRQGPLVASATTDGRGFYSASLPIQPHDWFLVVTSSGSYKDEITQQAVAAGPHDALRTVIGPATGPPMLSPMTTFAAARTMSLAANGVSTEMAAAVSVAAVSADFNLPDVTSIFPEVALLPPGQQSDIADFPSRQLGLILAGLDQEASSLGVSDLALSDAIATDLSDGNLDSKDGSTNITLPNGTTLPADATTARLQSGINTVAASPDNHTGDPAPQISPQPMDIGSPRAGALYVCSNALPAFVDGEASAYPLTECGGTAPFHCKLTVGAMPDDFGFSPSCGINYTGRPILGSAVTRYSAPFTYTMTDSSSPPATVTLSDRRITTVEAPPSIHVAYPIRCPSPDEKPCSELAATASGGLAPYTFWEGFQALPIGLRLTTWAGDETQHHSQLGDLSGDRAMVIGTGSKAGDTLLPQAGSYDIQICVTDTAGFEKCDDTRVDVGPQPPPTPSPDNSESAPPETSQPAPPSNNLPPGFPTNLPDGDYRITACAGAPATGFNSCVDSGVQTVSGGDASALADAVSQLATGLASQCQCRVQYTPFSGTEFDLTATGNGWQDTLRVVKVG